MVNKLSIDVMKIVVCYVKPYELKKYFEMNGLSREMKFSYDGFDHMFTTYELRELCGYFPGMMWKGVSVRLKSRDKMRWLKVEKLRGYTDYKYVVKNLMGCGAFLRSLDLSGCRNLVDFSFLRFCGKLGSLNLSGCQGLRDLNVLGGLNVGGLVRLGLSGCGNLRYDYEVWGEFFGRCGELRSLDLSYCGCVKSVDFLVGCLELRYVNLSFLCLLRNVDGLFLCRRLRVCIMMGCVKVENVDGLMGLRRLDVRGCGGVVGCLGGEFRRIRIFYSGERGELVENVCGSGSGERLRRLRLYNGDDESVEIGFDVNGCRFRGLRKLTLVGSFGNESICRMIWLKSLCLIDYGADLRWLEDCVWLEDLKLIRCAGRISICGLVNLGVLCVVDCANVGFGGIGKCVKLRNVVVRARIRGREHGFYEFLAECGSLRELSVDVWPGNVLRRYEGLERLDANRCEGVCLSDLVGCKRLRELDVSHVRTVMDMSVLVGGCPRLEIVRAVGSSNLRNWRFGGICVVRF